MKIFGHRGAAGYKRENTLASFRYALELNVDGIEFDVRLSKDGVPVIIHDECLSRTMQREGIVGDLTLREIQASDSIDDRVPSLKEVLRNIGNSALINVELKEANATDASVRVLNELLDLNTITRNQLLITAFDWEAIARVRKLDPRLPVGLLYKGIPTDSIWEFAKEYNAKSINLDLDSVTPAFVKRAHAEDLQVMIFTVNAADDAKRLRAMGVDAIFSDVPDRVSSQPTDC